MHIFSFLVCPFSCCTFFHLFMLLIFLCFMRTFESSFVNFFFLLCLLIIYSVHPSASTIIQLLLSFLEIYRMILQHSAFILWFYTKLKSNSFIKQINIVFHVLCSKITHVTSDIPCTIKTQSLGNIILRKFSDRLLSVKWVGWIWTRVNRSWN